jgi:tagaturonate reductase
LIFLSRGDETSVHAVSARLPSFSRAHWPDSAYRRDDLPERVLQFGTGMLLRALCAASVDAANRAGAFNGRIVVVQSTPHGNARAINAQDGLFTLVERGLLDGTPIERSHPIGAVSRALVADTDWPAVRAAVAQPELRVIVSNVTEAGFRLDADVARPDPTSARAPAGFPAKLADVLFARFERLPDGPPLYVIPTELVPDNGPRLGAMIDRLASQWSDRFRAWLSTHVHFCSSLVDRITTGNPPAELRATLEAQLGYSDELLTLTEPYALWAVEGEPGALREAFPIDVAPDTVVFASDIAMYRERKLRLLNGTHTALAPLALLAGVATVREAAEHPRLGAFLERVLFQELVPGTDIAAAPARAFAAGVVERFRNPWLEHEWRVIATNQTTKMRVRVAPAIERFVQTERHVPQGLALACAAHLRYLRPVSEGAPPRSAPHGRWRGAPYPIVDADLPLVARHWLAVDPDRASAPLPRDTLERLTARALADEALWGSSLARLPGFLEATTQALARLEHEGVEATLG